MSDNSKYYSVILDDGNYYIICRGPESILNYIDLIQSDDNIARKTGKLIIDQILVSGDDDNRFSSVLFEKGRIIIDSIKPIIGTESLKKITSQIFKKNLQELSSSILSSDQRFRIIRGLPL